MIYCFMMVHKKLVMSLTLFSFLVRGQRKKQRGECLHTYRGRFAVRDRTGSSFLFSVSSSIIPYDKEKGLTLKLGLHGLLPEWYPTLKTSWVVKLQCGRTGFLTH